MSRVDSAVGDLARADLLLLVARMLEAPDAWLDLDREIAPEDVDVLSAASGLDDLPEGAARLRCAVAEWRSVDTRTAAAEHSRLFEGPLACAPNETIFVRRDKGAVLADIAGFYRAFGFELSERFREKHDHIVAELQFAALLLVLAGRATEAGRPDRLEVARSALHGFLGDHLGVWIAAFAERLEGVSSTRFYAATGRLASAVWTLLAPRHGLTELDRATEATPEQTGTPYECGMCMPAESPEAG